MFYKLKRPTDIDWFDLFQLEHPDRAIGIITQMRGPRYQGQSSTQLIEGLSQLCPNGHINPSVVERAMRSGEFFLIPCTEAMSPMLHQVVRLNTTDPQGSPQTSEWQLTTNTFSEHLTSTLNFLIRQTPKPVFAAAAVRQKAKPASAAAKKADAKPKKLLTIAKIARKLRQIEGGSKYEEACFFASKIGWEGICGLVEVGHPENDPNLMPSRYMILPGASDDALQKKGNLNKYPYPIHSDAPSEFSVFNLKRFLSATGHLSDDRPFWQSKDRRTDTELQELQSDNFLQSTNITEKAGRDEFDSATESALNQYIATVDNAAPKAGSHTVKAGETLSSIAKDYGYPNWQVLWHHNKHDIKNPDLILEGSDIDLPDLVNDELEPWFHEFDNGQQVWSGANHYRFPANYFSISLLDKTEKPIDNIKNGVFEAYRLEPNQLFYSLKVSSFDQISVLMPDCDNLRVHTPGFNILNLKDNQQDIQQHLSASSGSGAKDTLQTSSISNSMATNTGAYLQADYSEDE